MRKNLTFIIFAAVLFLTGATEKSFAQSGLESTVNSYIARKAKIEKADEYADARKIVTGDLNGDGKEDAAVQYTLEGYDGGNSFGQMLVLFINNGKGGYRATNEVVVGGKFATHTSTLDRIANRKIILNTEACPPDVAQGMCQNPKKGIARYVLSGTRLRKG